MHFGTAVNGTTAWEKGTGLAQQVSWVQIHGALFALSRLVFKEYLDKTSQCPDPTHCGELLV